LRGWFLFDLDILIGHGLTLLSAAERDRCAPAHLAAPTPFVGDRSAFSRPADRYRFLPLDVDSRKRGNCARPVVKPDDPGRYRRYAYGAMPPIEPHAEHFAHDADVGVRGIGPTREVAFEQAAVALSAAVTEIERIAAATPVEIRCAAPNDELLLADWLNALIYEMATRHMLFRRFAVGIADHRLDAVAWGEPVDRLRHEPAVEPKGASYTELRVTRREDGAWIAQCVIDV
jgi:tRNA nucleotidyltransferase (CCA-adding enzyme)